MKMPWKTDGVPGMGILALSTLRSLTPNVCSHSELSEHRSLKAGMGQGGMQAQGRSLVPPRMLCFSFLPSYQAMFFPFVNSPISWP